MGKTATKAASSKTVSGKATATKTAATKNFEDRLERLELLGEQIRKTDIPWTRRSRLLKRG